MVSNPSCNSFAMVVSRENQRRAKRFVPNPGSPPNPPQPAPQLPTPQPPTPHQPPTNFPTPQPNPPPPRHRTRQATGPETRQDIQAALAAPSATGTAAEEEAEAELRARDPENQARVGGSRGRQHHGFQYGTLFFCLYVPSSSSSSSSFSAFFPLFFPASFLGFLVGRGFPFQIQQHK